MNEVLRMSRKALIVSLTVATLAWGVLAAAMFAPLTASAAGCTSGTLIKGSLPAVYYCGADGKRYVFTNDKAYWTWYPDFSGVMVISDADLATVQIGGNVTYRPGVKMIKIQSDPKVYAVSKNGTLRPITDEAAAASLYGANWNQQIDDVSDAFFTNYTVGSAISGPSDYDKNAEMSASQTINQDKGLSSGGVAVGGGVSKASDSPLGATLPRGAMSVNFLKFHVSNSGSSAMTVDTVTVHRQGAGATSDISAVYLYEGNERLTTGRSINSSSNEATFTGLGLVLGAGTTRTLWVAVDIATGAGSGTVHAMSVTSVMASGNNLAGTPVTGSDFTIAGVTVGSLTIARTGSITNPKLGESEVKVAEFTIAAGASEDVRFERLTLFQGGNLSGANLTNLKLKQAGLTIATATGFNSKLRATFVLSSPGMLLEKGATKTFQVYADIGGSARSGDTIRLYVEEDSDLFGLGQTFGYGTTVVRTAYDNSANDGTDASWSSVDAGQVTITFVGPSSKDVPLNGRDVEIYRFRIVAQSNVEVRNLRWSLTANGDGLTDGGTTANYTDIKVTNVANSSTWWGPSDVAAAGNDTTQSIVFTDVQTLTAGQVYEFSVTTDLANVAGMADDNFTMTFVAFTGSDLRNLDNSTFLATTDVVPSGNLAGNQHTVKAPSLLASLGAIPVSQSYVKGTAGVDMVGINLKSGDASAVTLTELNFIGVIDDVPSSAFADGVENGLNVSDVITACRLMDGTTQLGDAKSPTVATGVMNFTGLNNSITAGMTKSLKVNCDLSNSAPGSERVAFHLVGATAQDPDGSAVTVTDDGTTALATGNRVNASGGNTTADTAVTITTAGTMTYAVAPSDTESEAGLVIAGQSGVVLAKMRLTAQNEELKQTKLRVYLTTAANYTNVVSMSLYDGATLIAGPVPVDSSGHADFSGMNFVVPKDGSKTMTVKATLNTISGGATSGADLTTAFQTDASTGGTFGNFEYRGTSSSTVVTTNENAVDADTTGAQKVLRKTKPTVSLASLPTTTLTDGSKTLARITVTADSAEQVSLKSIIWTIAKTGGAEFDPTTGSSVREVGQGSNIVGSASETSGDCDGAGTACTLQSIFTSEQVIPAGTSKTYELVMTASSIASTDSVSTNIASDTALVTGELANSGGHIDDLDGTNAVTTGYNLTWSDNSAIPHNDVSGAFADDAAAPGDAAASDDWTNGLYVKVLPSDAQTLTAL